MAYINETMKTGSGEKIHVKVPGAQGGQDRCIYLDGKNKGYHLGKSDDQVYKNGQFISSSIKGFLAGR